MTAVLIAVFGAAGSLARWGLSTLVRTPYGTLLVNLVGSAAIGLVMGWFAARHALDSRARMALTFGLLGGFTTYSSFAWESLTLVDQRAFAWAGIYIVGTVVTCLLACGAGLLLGRTL